MTTDAAVRNPVEREGSRYVTSRNLDLAVRVAEATRRPLLLFGDPGSGKSSLARYVAWRENRRYYEQVITARTEARDLLWTFDSVRRLSDAQVGEGISDGSRYILPGVFWWAFDRTGAAALPRASEPFADWNASRSGTRAVVLIDEIDKADPDVPNSLLVPLAGRYFTVTDLDGAHQVQEDTAQPSLIVITSNQERDLPPAFERRCVVYRLEPHGEKALRDIADRHINGHPLGQALLGHLIKELDTARQAAQARSRRLPSTAEFLDVVRACQELSIVDSNDDELKEILGMIFEKDRGFDPLEAR